MSWSAKISREQMAVALCDDLLKKFRQLERLPQDKAKLIGEGLVDGLCDRSITYPNDSRIPNFLKSMEPDYCAGFEVGSTWRRIAKEWEE